jgi:SAM-dependent methyltransferase
MPERDLKEYYRKRAAWRRPKQESMRLKAAARLAAIPENSTVLDLGCRDGGFREFLPQSTIYRGMDIADEFEAEHIVIGDISQGLPFEDEFYDYVFAVEVLEHTTDPYNIFKEVKRILKPGGYFVLSVPNPYHFKEIIWNIFKIPDRQGHIFSWTRQAMTEFGRTAGFTLEKTGGSYIHPPIPARGLLSRSIIYKFKK